jgi:succinoglycan biosynthesis protein ExoA
MRFSLVIPVAPDRGAEIIGSIRKLDYPKSDFHVIVVNGSNTSENRNKGASRALGEHIVFLDDDATIEVDYLLKIEDFFDRHPEIDIVGGPQLTPEDDKGFARISGYALSSLFGAWTLMSRYTATKEILDADEKVLTSANLACHRKVMDKIQFDPNLFPGEDPKFIEDCKKEKFLVGYTPQMRIFHRRRGTLRGLTKQIFNYGKVRPKKESFFATLKRPFFLVPSLFFIYIILLLGSILINPSITGNVVGSEFIKNLEFWWFVPILLYVILMLMFGIYDSVKNKDYKAIFILIFMYPIIHLSYGAGMIWGYLRK